MERMNIRGTRKRIVLRNIALVVALLIAVFFVLQHYFYHTAENVYEAAQAAVTQDAERIATGLKKDADNDEVNLAGLTFVLYDYMEQNEPKHLEKVLAEIVGDTPFDKVGFIDLDGERSLVEDGSTLRTDVADTDSYITGMQGKSGAWMECEGEVVTYYIYAPLYYEGELLGIVEAQSDPVDEFYEVLQNTLFGEAMDGFICDSTGKIYGSTGKEYIGAELEDYLAKQVSDKEEAQSIAEKACGSSSHYSTYRDQDGEAVIAANRIGNSDWVVVEMASGEATSNVMQHFYAGAVEMVVMIAIIFVILLVLVMILSYLGRKKEQDYMAQLRNVNQTMQDDRRAFEQLYELLSAGTWYIWPDEEGNAQRVLWTDSVRHMLGFDTQLEYPNAMQSWYSHVHPEDQKRVLDQYFETVRDQTGTKQYDCEYRMLNKQGEYRWFRAVCNFLRNEDGSIRYGIGLFINVNDKNVAEQSSEQQLAVLKTLADIYHDMYLIDLEEDTILLYSSLNHADKLAVSQEGAGRKMHSIIEETIQFDHLERAYDFVNLDKLRQRMRYRKTIAEEFLARKVGWIRANFVTVEARENGLPSKVLFAAMVIDEEKRREENLLLRSNTDELTGFLNRRAYEIDMKEYQLYNPGDEFVFVSMDINGLKQVNDTLGHAAGDELIQGAAQCMKASYLANGKIYRTGGDEFVALIYANEKQLHKIIKDFEEHISAWKGEMVSEVAVACGYARMAEQPGTDVTELAKIADERMYEAKAAYYASTGVDRRVKQEAFAVISQSYFEIFKVNLTRDSYFIIQTRHKEFGEEQKGYENFSQTFITFAKSGRLYEDDKENFLTRTNLTYLRNYFYEGNKNYSIQYREKPVGEFITLQLEMVKAPEYTNDNQIVYLYAKQIM
ncbi:MAG: diguanylate cyclase [Eubacterium sp.]|nr:diguanylate cyclase [Eubacterium sp.]